MRGQRGPDYEVVPVLAEGVVLNDPAECEERLPERPVEDFCVSPRVVTCERSDDSVELSEIVPWGACEAGALGAGPVVDSIEIGEILAELLPFPKTVTSVVERCAAKASAASPRADSNTVALSLAWSNVHGSPTR